MEVSILRFTELVRVSILLRIPAQESKVFPQKWGSNEVLADAFDDVFEFVNEGPLGHVQRMFDISSNERPPYFVIFQICLRLPKGMFVLFSGFGKQIVFQLLLSLFRFWHCTFRLHARILFKSSASCSNMSSTRVLFHCTAMTMMFNKPLNLPYRWPSRRFFSEKQRPSFP